MRVLLWSFLSAVVGLLTCTMIGCGRKAPPVAQNAPVPPRVAESPRTPMTPRDPRPVRPNGNEETNPDKVADFGGPPRKDVPQTLDFDPPMRPEPMQPGRPGMEEEEPKKPQPPAKFEPRKNDPLRGIAPIPDVPPDALPMLDTPKVEGPKVAPPERRIENVQPIQPTKPVARRPVTKQDMMDIHLFVDTASGASGRMPDPTTIQAALGAAGSPAAKLVATEDIVLTGARQRESCWAYQKGATTDGGWIVTNSGAEQVDAATAKRLIGGR